MDKQRIISHMNKDHQLALVDYTVVYGHEKLSNFHHSSVKIIDTDEECLTLTYKTQADDTKNLVIVWNEAEDGQDLKVNTMSDIKAKLIAMAKHAAAKQGYSHKRITTVVWPNDAISISINIIAAFLVAASIKKGLIGKLFGSLLSAKSIAFAEKYVAPLTLAVTAIHVVEMLLVVLPDTIKYRMPFKVQISWLAMTVIEGAFAISRLKKLKD